MKYKEWILRVSLFLSVLAVVGMSLIVVISFWYYRPLHPTWRWQVTATTHDGERLSVKPYKMLGRNVFFLRIHDSGDTLDGKKDIRWFAICFPSSRDKRLALEEEQEVLDDVVVYHTDPGTSPCLYYPADVGGYGIDILDGKVEECWYLTYSNKSVVFSNSVFSVSAKRPSLAFKTAEVHRHTGDNLGK